MDKTKVSDKYQVVIPKSIREAVKLKKGQTLQVLEIEDGSILLTPDKVWPDSYLGTQKDIWGKVNVARYLRSERGQWMQKS